MPTYDRVTVSSVDLRVGFGIASVKDIRSGTLPLYWSELAEAEGVFGANLGPLYVHDVPAKVEYWTNKIIKFLPQQEDLENTANYDVHVYVPKTSPPNEYLHDFTTDLTGPWTFSRGSEATAPIPDGTIQHYPSETPAWHGNHGLQLETSRTNHFRYSTDFRFDTQKGADTTLTAYPGIVAPDGSTDAYRAAGLNHIWQANTAPNIQQDMCSMWARTISGTGEVGLFVGKYDTDTNVVTLDDTWRRFSHISGENTSFYIADFRDPAVTLSEFLVWGPQCERLAPAPSSFIHNDTGETATTRAQTQCQATFTDLGSPLPAGGLPNNFCGQFVFKLLHPTSALNGKAYLDISDSTGSSVFRMVQIGSMMRLSTYTTSTDWLQLNLTFDPLQEGDLIDIRFKVSASEGQSLWVNENNINNATYTNGFDESLSKVTLGATSTFATPSNIAAIKFRLIPTALSDNAIEGWV